MQGVFICKALAFWSLWSTSETLLKVVYFSQLPRKKEFDLKTQALPVSKGIVVQAAAFLADLLSWLNMTWFCSRSHIAGLVGCQAHTPVPGVWTGLGEQPSSVDRRAMPLALVLCGWISRTMHICFIFAVLCPVSGWGSGGGEFTMCGSHQLFTILHR